MSADSHDVRRVDPKGPGENVRQGDPQRFKLKVFGGETLQRLLSRARERRYFEVPLLVAEYDAAARLGDLPDLS